MKMAELVERYLEHRRPGLSRQTFKNYQSTLGRLATAWDKTRRVPQSLDEDWMGDFLAKYRRGQGGNGQEMMASTYNKSVEQFKAFLEWGVRKGIIRPFVVDACVRMPKQKPREFLRLSAAEVVHMIETTEDPWERWVLAYASQTLGRDSELRNRQVKHLHLGRGTLDWYRKKTVDLDELPITRQLATEWDRWVHFYQDRCGSIQPHWPLVPARFVTNVAILRRHPNGRVRAQDCRGFSFDPTRPPHELAGIVKKHASRVSRLPVEDLKGQGVHILRRSMARALYERLRDEGHPEPLRVVQAALGHADQQTTRIYIGVRPDRMERNALLAGSDLLWSDISRVSEIRPSGTFGAASTETSNIVELRSVDHG